MKMGNYGVEEAESALERLLSYCREMGYLSERRISSTAAHHRSGMKALRRLNVRRFAGFYRAFDLICSLIDDAMRIRDEAEERRKDPYLRRLLDEYRRKLVRALFEMTRGE